MIRKYHITSTVLLITSIMFYTFLVKETSLNAKSVLINLLIVFGLIFPLTEKKIILKATQQNNAIVKFGKKSSPYTLFIVLLAFVIIMHYSKTQYNGEHILAFGLIISGIIKNLINLNYNLYIEDNKLYNRDLFNKSFNVSKIVKIELTKNKELLIYDMKKTKIFPLKEEDSIFWKNKIEALQQELKGDLE